VTGEPPDPLERLRIRTLIEGYFAALDRHDSRGIADCFTADAAVSYLDGKVQLVGGSAVAEYLRFLESFEAVQHTISSLRIDVDGDGARVDTLAVAVLLESSGDAQRLMFRGVHYDDRLVDGPDGWRIQRRAHRGLWQHDATPAPLFVPHSR
jgi:ketosteroid isomerase-like protein